MRSGAVSWLLSLYYKVCKLTVDTEVIGVGAKQWLPESSPAPAQIFV